MSTLPVEKEEIMDAEIVKRSLATIETKDPVQILTEASKAASALQDVISKKKKPVMMNGEIYLEFEDWQTLGRFYGITAKEDGDAEFVQYGDIQGFKASCIAVDAQGREISRATAFCLSDEEKWGSRAKYAWLYVLKSGGHSVVGEEPDKSEMIWEPNPSKPGGNRPRKERILVGEEKVPLYQLASMAQTRASAKCLRNVLSWVAVLAGYKPTPAEEMPDDQKTPSAPIPSQQSVRRTPEQDAKIQKARQEVPEMKTATEVFTEPRSGTPTIELLLRKIAETPGSNWHGFLEAVHKKGHLQRLQAMSIIQDATPEERQQILTLATDWANRSIAAREKRLAKQTASALDGDEEERSAYTKAGDASKL